MNVDRILSAFNDAETRYLLVGGMNFLLRHDPVVTFDVDIWIEASPTNVACAEKALIALDASWGERESDWGPVKDKEPGWLGRQSVYCLTSAHGSIDVFTDIKGLEDWKSCRDRAVEGQTAAGVAYIGLCDADMLTCQESLDENDRKPGRIAALRKALDEHGQS